MALASARYKGNQRVRPASRNQTVSISNKEAGQGKSTEDKIQRNAGPPGKVQLLSPAKVSRVNGGPPSPRRVVPSKNGSKVSNGLSGSELPNQPTTTPVVQVESLAQSSQSSPAATTAAVKWKSSLSAVDKDSATRNKSPNHELIPLDLERNDSTLTSARDSPRNLLSAAGSNADGNDRVKSSSGRKLSLGDFVTGTVQQTRQSPVKWDTLESTNGLVSSLPYVPVSLAYTCLIMNVVIPGSGTILAGMSMMCCGEPRGQTKPDELFSQFTTNLFVGISQFFTVTFFLAGWIWSITWGVYLVLFAEENKLRKAAEEKRKKTAAITNTLWDR